MLHTIGRCAAAAAAGRAAGCSGVSPPSHPYLPPLVIVRRARSLVPSWHECSAQSTQTSPRPIHRGGRVAAVSDVGDYPPE
jgi:hypothetical protein